MLQNTRNRKNNSPQIMLQTHAIDEYGKLTRPKICCKTHAVDAYGKITPPELCCKTREGYLSYFYLHFTKHLAEE